MAATITVSPHESEAILGVLARIGEREGASLWRLREAVAEELQYPEKQAGQLIHAMSQNGPLVKFGGGSSIHVWLKTDYEAYRAEIQRKQALAQRMIGELRERGITAITAWGHHAGTLVVSAEDLARLLGLDGS